MKGVPGTAGPYVIESVERVPVPKRRVKARTPLADAIYALAPGKTFQFPAEQANLARGACRRCRIDLGPRVFVVRVLCADWARVWRLK